ncbi:MAG: hypothetical protein A2Y17_04810 [Clostridiales bacterium GWF2_38_85]|nr:MAG: hypothetical protein A2Y17_04810 [Clostridiales bacterium GWF2_38_85]HBL84391.1 hypothetical protein [Clostridiales bacterium]
MNHLITECNNLLKNQGFDYAFCGGHAIDLYLGKETRPHGDIDISAFWEDRNKIIAFMQSQGWIVYEAMGGGVVHLITDTADQKLIKLNIFCVREGCPFFHAELVENDMYRCDIEHVEQTSLDYIEFLLNKRDDSHFIYSRNKDVRLELDKAILKNRNIRYLAPELVLLYKSIDLIRVENQQDFNATLPHLTADSKLWLKNALQTSFPDGYEWIDRIQEN